MLYWDEIGSIVPYGKDKLHNMPNDRDTEYLIAEDAYRPFSPRPLLEGSYEEQGAFLTEFKSILTTTEIAPSAPAGEFFRVHRNKVPSKLLHFLQHPDRVHRKMRIVPRALADMFSRVHRNKVSDAIFYHLQKHRLALKLEDDYEWYYFEKKTALLYMALLAKYLAKIDRGYTVVGTDQSEYDNLMFHMPRTTNTRIDLSTHLANILPMPTEDTDLARIIKFRDNHRNELYRFRDLIDQYISKLGECQDSVEVKELITSFQEKLENGVADLLGLLKSSHIRTVFGSLKTLVKLKSPALWGTIGIVANQAKKIVDLPLSWSLLGVGIIAGVEVSAHIVDDFLRNRTTLRESPFAYVLHAKQAGVIA